MDEKSSVQEDGFEQLLNGQVWNITSIEEEVFVGHDTGTYVLNGRNRKRECLN